MHRDIRLGTLADIHLGAAYLRQILPHGFESFSLVANPGLAALDLRQTAAECLQTLGDKAVISSVSLYGNPMLNETTRLDLEKLIDAAPLFGTDLLCAFTGALDGEPLENALPIFKKIWEPLARRARDAGVRIAFENCAMGGRWEAARVNIAQSPAAWEKMFDLLPAENIGLQWEPCHHMANLIDPLPQLRAWAHKVFHVHGKDANILWDVLRTSGLNSGKTWLYNRTPGFGDTNWADIISTLRLAKFSGSIDIEGWHDPVYKGDLEMTGQVHGLEYLKRCRGGDFQPNPT